MKLEKLNEQLLWEKKRFEFVYSNTSISIWEYDIIKKELIQLERSQCKHGLEFIVKDIPNAMIKSGFILPDSVDDIIEMYEKLTNGIKEVEGIFHIKDLQTGKMRYEKVKYLSITNENGKANRAIGMAEDVTELREKEIAYLKWKELSDNGMFYNSMIIEYNITKDFCENVKGDLINLLKSKEAKFDEASKLLSQTIYKEDRAMYLQTMNRANLIEQCQKGESEFNFDFRKYFGNDTKWINVKMQTIQHPYGNDLLAYIIITDVSNKKSREIEEKNKLERDALTNTYNRSKITELVGQIIAENPNVQHAFIMFDLDGFKKVNDNFGHLLGDKVLKDITTSLMSLLRTGDLIGRLGGDEFLLFLKDIPYDDVIDRRAQLICQMINLKLNADVIVTGSLGISMYPRDGLSFDELYSKADIALYQSKNTGKGKYAFYDSILTEKVGKLTPIDDHTYQENIRRKQEEAAIDIIQKNEELSKRQMEYESYRLIMESSNVVIFRYSFETQVFFASSGFANCKVDLSGREQIFISKQYRDSLIYSEDRLLIENNIYAKIKKGESKAEESVRLKQKNGEYKWYHLTAIAIRNEKNKITDSINMMTEMDLMRESADIQLQALLNNMAGGVILYEVAEEINDIYVSQSYYTMLKYSGQSLSLNGGKTLSVIKAEDKFGFEQALRKGAKTGEIIDHIYRCAADNGEIRWRHIRAVRIPYEKSNYPVLSAVITDVTELKNSEMNLKIQNEKMHFALAQTNTMAWVVNLAEMRLTEWIANEDGDANAQEYTNIPESLLTNKIVLQSSYPDLVNLCKNMQNGVSSDECAIQIKKSKANYNWAKLKYQLIYDNDNKPIKAVGITEWLPNIANAKSMFEQEILLFNAVKHKILAAIITDLSTNKIVALYVEGKSILSYIKNDNYNDYLTICSKSIVDEEDIVILNEKFSIANLIKGYESGNSIITMDYKKINSAGSIEWASATVNIYNEPISGDLYSFSYIKNIDKRKKWELALDRRVDREILTNLYSPQTMSALCSIIQKKQRKSTGTCALVLFSMQKLAQLKNDIGLSAAGRIVSSNARLFVIILDSPYVVGIGEQDTFAVFLPKVFSADDAQKRVGEFINTIHEMKKLSKINEDLGFIAGVSIADYKNANYETMEKEALQAIQQSIKDMQDQQIPIYHYEVTESNIFMLLKDKNYTYEIIEIIDKTAAKEAEYLSAIYDITLALIETETISKGINTILSTIGLYYESDRVGMLVYDSSKEQVSLKYEYTKSGIDSIMADLQNNNINDYPFLVDCYSSGKIIVLKEKVAENNTNQTADANNKNICKNINESDKNSQRNIFLIVSPIIYEDRMIGFTCIENPHKHNDSVCFLYESMQWATSEYSNRIKKQNVGKSLELDNLTGLLNRNSYSFKMHEFNSSFVSSLGIVYADINGLKNVNANFGEEAGDRLILKVASLLKSQFKPTEIYRTSGDEFVVISENYTYEVFKTKCDKLRIIEEEKEMISVGSAWADKDININIMLNHAESISEIAKANYHSSIGNQDVGSKKLKGLLKAINNGWFKVFLQPKTNIITNKTCGAEALVRCMHPEKGFLTPNRFIGVLENANIIKYLDFFVLDETLKIMQNWKDKGMELIPISVNYSKQTILDKEAILETEKIMSKYNIPYKFVEIEITESIGNLERTTIVAACHKFKEKGFMLALDDFGSDYSSLSILSSAQFDTVKIDKSLINDIVTRQQSLIIVESVLNMCKRLGIECVAEGTETEAQIHKLLDIGCEYAQGFYYNKPIPSTEFTSLYIK
ncbi:MAG: diguanylate cyclase [Clostridia bacterium]